MDFKILTHIVEMETSIVWFNIHYIESSSLDLLPPLLSHVFIVHVILLFA